MVWGSSMWARLSGIHNTNFCRKLVPSAVLKFNNFKLQLFQALKSIVGIIGDKSNVLRHY